MAGGVFRRAAFEDLEAANSGFWTLEGQDDSAIRPDLVYWLGKDMSFAYINHSRDLIIC